MAHLLVVTPDAAGADALPGLALLAHRLDACPPDADALTAAARADVVVVDARADLAAARTVCRLFAAAGTPQPLLLVLSEGGFVAVRPDWGVADIVCDTAGPAELQARLRLLLGRTASTGVLSSGHAARGIVNRAMRELGALDNEAPAFPLATAAIAPLRAAAEKEGRGDFTPLWSGQNASACRAVSAVEVTRALAQGLHDT